MISVPLCSLKTERCWRALPCLACCCLALPTPPTSCGHPAIVTLSLNVAPAAADTWQ